MTLSQLRSLLAVAAFSCTSCSPPASGEPSLDVVLTPSAFGPGATDLKVVIHATDAAGKVGTGTVSASVDIGSLDPDSASLDAYGSARLIWHCETGCTNGGALTARWNTTTAKGVPQVAQFIKRVTYDTEGVVVPIAGQSTVVVATASGFRVTGTVPGAGWNSSTSFDDGSWLTPVVTAAKGTQGIKADAIWDQGPTQTVGSSQIWIRRTFELPAGDRDSALLDVSCNDDMQVFVNGSNVINDTDGVSTTRTAVDVKAFLVAGTNVIAATCADVVLPDHAIWLSLVVRSH